MHYIWAPVRYCRLWGSLCIYKTVYKYIFYDYINSQSCATVSLSSDPSKHIFLRSMWKYISNWREDLGECDTESVWLWMVWILFFVVDVECIYFIYFRTSWIILKITIVIVSIISFNYTSSCLNNITTSGPESAAEILNLSERSFHYSMFFLPKFS